MRAEVLCSDDVAEVSKFLFLDSGYKFCFCTSLIQYRFIGSMIFPAHPQQSAYVYSMSFQMAVNLSMSSCKGLPLVIRCSTINRSINQFLCISGNFYWPYNLSLICLLRVRSLDINVSDCHADLATAGC